MYRTFKTASAAFGLKKPLATLTAVGLLTAAPAMGATINLNFHDESNGPTAATNWNNVEVIDGTDNTPGDGIIAAGNAGTNLSNLIFSDGASSGVSISIDAGNQFNGNSNVGEPALSGAAAALFPNDVGVTYGWAISEEDDVVLRFSNLDPTMTYAFTIFASRAASGPTNRTGTYTVAGLTIDSGDLNANQNASNVLALDPILPDLLNEITLTISNGQTGAFTFLNGLSIEVVPEPASLALLGLGGLAMLGGRRRPRSDS